MGRALDSIMVALVAAMVCGSATLIYRVANLPTLYSVTVEDADSAYHAPRLVTLDECRQARRAYEGVAVVICNAY